MENVIKCGAELSGKNEFWIGSVREQEAEAERTHRHTRRAEPACSDRRQKSYSPPEGGRIALSANERIDGFLSFAIQTKFAYVNKRVAGRFSPPQTINKKLFSPEKGRIALSANERIAEFLDFVLQAKFAYVNKRRRADSARFLRSLGNVRAFCKRRRRRWKMGLWGNRNVIQQGRSEEDDSREF